MNVNSPSMTSGDAANDTKKKKTKLEKIGELETEMKLLKDENKKLKKQVHYLKKSSSSSNHPSSPKPSLLEELESITTGGGTADGQNSSVAAGGESSSVAGGSMTGGSTVDDKLKDALRALKRVTMKQELELKKLRQKSKQRRHEIETKDRIMDKLQNEIQSLKDAFEKIRNATSDQDLKLRLVDLELQLAKEKATKEHQSKELSRSQHDVQTLQGQLAKVKNSNLLGAKMMKQQSSPSSKSFQSNDNSNNNNNTSNNDDLGSMASSTIAEDGAYIAKLRKELSKRIETIANLEFELETARDEIHDMKRNKQYDNATFPMTPPPGKELDDFFAGTSDEDDDDDDDDFWGESSRG